MVDNQPFVSVCTPTFNRRPFISSMIECFNHQTYPKDKIERVIYDSSIEDEKVEQGTIIQEIQPGFMIGERLLSPSIVGISKKKGEKNDKNK